MLARSLAMIISVVQSHARQEAEYCFAMMLPVPMYRLRCEGGEPHEFVAPSRRHDQVVNHFGDAADERFLHQVRDRIIEHPGLNAIEPIRSDDAQLISHVGFSPSTKKAAPGESGWEWLSTVVY